MRKQSLFIFFMLLLFHHLEAQDKAADRLQQMQARLEGLQGPERIACLNDIAQSMMYTSYKKWDSSLYYSKLAMEEAKKMGFTRGLARAHIIHGDGLLQYQRATEGEKYFREAIRIAEEFKYPGLLNMAHRRLGQALWYQGKFKEAIDEISSTISFFEKASGNNNYFQLINCYTSIANIYNDWGNYEKGFEYSQKALVLSKEKKDTDNIIHCYTMIGSLYAGVGDIEAAFDYYRLAVSHLQPCDNCYQMRLLNVVRGNLYRTAGNYDSSMYYLLKAYDGNPSSTLTRLFIAETLVKQQRYDTALLILTELRKYHDQHGEAARSWQLNTTLGTAYFGKKRYDSALYFTGNGLQEAYRRGLRGEYIADAFKLMSSIHKITERNDSALFYFEQYATIKDSLISDQLKGKLFEFKRIAEDEKKQSQIELLKQQARQDLLIKNLLIAGIVLLFIMAFFIFRFLSLKRRNERLKNEQLQSQLQHKATELEMQALRAQMNPHFIFNCLSSINRFILKNETETASDYLTRFSRLIRLVLIHSRSSLIPLKDEIEMLKLYLDMEKLRFKDAFDYTISFSNSINPEAISIPPLLLQPFCENAIWHGLMHKEGRGHLEISMSADQDQLTCVIMDDGVGRTKASEIKSHSGEAQKSLGLKITAERLALINKEKGLSTSYEIEDLTDNAGEPTGTKVTLCIHYDQSVKAFV
jgi:hypothetical protein